LWFGSCCEPASGLPDEQLNGALACGVAKINITELYQAYKAAVVSALPSVLNTHDGARCGAPAERW
jgi:fructose/tagatose bisphosphate aldolase